MENQDFLDQNLYDQPTRKQLEYGGFWERFAAALIDGLILMIPNFAFNLIGEGIGGALSLVVGWLYSATQESGEAQATIGKKAMGLVVIDAQTGGRLTFAQATGRHFGKYISIIILAIGFIMQAFTERRQALHDIMANTLVVKSNPYR